MIETAVAPSRVLGRLAGEGSGPTIIVMAGIHGNEPAGPQALSRVLAEIERRKPDLRGSLVAVAGNLSALRNQTRYVDVDLNRRWTPEVIERLGLSADGGRPPAEDAEQLALIELLAEEIAGATGPIHFLDLHTSSADGPPFLTVGDTLYNRRFAQNFPLPLILGLEEQVDGALLEYLNNLGITTLGVEAGRHDRAESVERIEAVLWLALHHTGMIAADSLPELDRCRSVLASAGKSIPRIVEVRRRHAITPEDDFRMEPGFGNFDVVDEGQLLARDQHGPVLSPEKGRILLPLYQGKGSDGFFITREVRGAWLALSSVLRRLRLGALLRVLPGVRTDRSRREVMVVDTRIARWRSLDVFHLFGYRKLRRVGSELIVSRRRFDLAPPSSVTMPRTQEPVLWRSRD